MSISTAGIPGPFCWIELAASDAERATAFYGELFGWPAHRQRIGPVPMMRLTRDGADIGSLYPLGGEQRVAGVPPHWTPYVAVADLEAAGVVRPRWVEASSCAPSRRRAWSAQTAWPHAERG